MPYCTLDDLENMLPEAELIQLTDDEGLGVVNQPRMDQAISGADSLIDGYCGGLYDVPFTSVPALIQELSAELAICSLFERKADVLPDTLAERRKEAVQKLEAIGAGALSLGIQTAGGKPATNSDVNNRILTMEGMEEF